MLRHLSLPSFLGLLTLLAPPAHGEDKEHEDYVWQALEKQPGGITANRVAVLAVKTAPALDQRDADIAQTQAENDSTLSRYYPNVQLTGTFRRTNPLEINFNSGGLSVGALNPGRLEVGTCQDGGGGCVVDSGGQEVTAVAVPVFTPPRNTYDLTGTLSIPLTDFLALLPAKRGADADLDVARLKKREEKLRIAANARIAFYDWARAKAQHAVTLRSLAGAKARYKDASLGVKAGTVTRADALALEGLVASSEIAVAEAESFERLAAQNIRVLTGLTEPLSMGQDLREKTPTAKALGALPELVDRGLKKRVEILGARRFVEATSHAISSARVQYLPKVQGIASATHANPNQQFFPPSAVWNTSWYIGLQASWQFDAFLNNRATIGRLDAAKQNARALVASLQRAIELEVRGAWEEWTRADATFRISKVQLKAAVANYEQRVLLFRGGEATSTDVIEAEVQRHDATLRSVNARIDRRIALVKLKRAAALDEESNAQGPRRE